jgi:hypothetical protein
MAGSHVVWQSSRGMFPHSTPVLHAMAMVYAFHAHVFPFLHSHGSEACRSISLSPRASLSVRARSAASWDAEV